MDNLKQELKWWEARRQGGEVHTMINAILDRLREDITRRRELAVRTAAVAGVDLSNFAMASAAQMIDDSVSFNAALATRNTLVAMTTKQRVIPQAYTNGGTWAERRRADEFNKGIEALLDQTEVYDRDPLWCSDALTFDMCLAFVTHNENKLDVERCFSWECAWDPLEARLGWKYVRSFYRFRLIDRAKLKEIYKDASSKVKDAIDAATFDSQDIKIWRKDLASDQVLVIDAWHLSSGPQAKDGWFARTLKDFTLELEPYERDKFPFATLYQAPPEVGITQHPMLARLATAQREFDKGNKKIQDAMDLLGVPRILANNASEIVKSDLDDEVGSIVRWSGNIPPQEWNAQPISPDVINYNEGIPGKMLRFEGVSEGSAHSQLPAGMKNASGKALQVYDDWESDRLNVFWRMRELFYIELVELILDECRDMSEEEDGYIVTTVNGKYIKQVKFADMDISQDTYVLRIQPTNMLSKSPSAKYTQVMDMGDRQYISPDEVRKLMNIPDLVAQNELDLAPVDIIYKQIEAIHEKKLPAIVLPTDNLDETIKLARNAFALARVNGEKDEIKDLLLDMMLQAQKLQAPPPPPPGAPPPGGAPMGPPGPPPGPGPAPMGGPPPGPPVPPMPMQ